MKENIVSVLVFFLLLFIISFSLPMQAQKAYTVEGRVGYIVKLIFTHTSIFNMNLDNIDSFLCFFFVLLYINLLNVDSLLRWRSLGRRRWLWNFHFVGIFHSSIVTIVTQAWRTPRISTGLLVN